MHNLFKKWPPTRQLQIVRPARGPAVSMFIRKRRMWVQAGWTTETADFMVAVFKPAGWTLVTVVAAVYWEYLYSDEVIYLI